MSVYKPGKTRFFQYDFRLKGRRFHGSTGVEGRRAAEAVERRFRELAALGKLDAGRLMTLDKACGRWWAERGEAARNARNRERQLQVVIDLLGASTPIVEITTARIATAIERRRGMTFTRAKGAGAARYTPSNTTVNRDVIDTLRPVLRRARRTWEVEGLPEIDWTSLRLPEPKPRPLEFSEAELGALAQACRPHWTPFIRFMARYGLRIGEMFFDPANDLDVADRDAARLVIRGAYNAKGERVAGRKGGDEKVLPLLPEDAAMLAALAGRAIDAGFETLWFREGKPIAGKPPKIYALSYGGAASALRRAMTRTGLRAAKGARGAHALRHNAGMKALRATSNLRLAQRLLGHSSIRSTLVYADAIEADLRAGLAAIAEAAQPRPEAARPDANSRNSPEADIPEALEGQLDQSAKASGA